jgi:DNA-binding GntR family transcriptional regulator
VADRAPRYREAAYQAIKEAILSGKLAPNQPLIEEQLAASLQISRTPVREALALLEHEQIIRTRGGRKLYVRQLSREEFVAMFVANEVTEPYLARRAARLAAPEHIAAMADAIRCGQEAATQNDLAAFLKSGRDFHRSMGQAADNPTLTQFAARNEEHTDLYLLSAGKTLESSNMQVSNAEHEAIYAAIVSGDPEAAERLVIYHAQSLRARLVSLFTKRDEDHE